MSTHDEDREWERERNMRARGVGQGPSVDVVAAMKREPTVDPYVEGLRAAAAVSIDLHAKASGGHPFDKGQRRNAKRTLDSINQMLIKEGAAPLALG